MGFAETFKALADPQRREILTLLRAGRMSAGEIAARFPITGASVSYHRGYFIDYELNTSVVEEVMLWLSELKGEGEHAGEPTAARADERDHPAADALRAAVLGAAAGDAGDALRRG